MTGKDVLREIIRRQAEAMRLQAERIDRQSEKIRKLEWQLAHVKGRRASRCCSPA